MTRAAVPERAAPRAAGLFDRAPRCHRPPPGEPARDTQCACRGTVLHDGAAHAGRQRSDLHDQPPLRAALRAGCCRWWWWIARSTFRACASTRCGTAAARPAEAHRWMRGVLKDVAAATVGRAEATTKARARSRQPPVHADVLRRGARAASRGSTARGAPLRARQLGCSAARRHQLAHLGAQRALRRPS